MDIRAAFAHQRKQGGALRAQRAQDIIQRRHPLAGGRADIVFIFATLRNKSNG